MWGTPVELTDVYSTELEQGNRSAVLQSELLSPSARAAMQTESYAACSVSTFKELQGSP